MVQHPKFFFFDAGVFGAIRPRGPLDSAEEVAGAALETLVLQELQATNDNRQLGYDLSYWRTHTGLEVDFVLYGPRGLLAFEVKRKRQLAGHDLRSLRAFIEDYPVARAYVLYNGDHETHLDGITAMPLARALPRLPEILSQA